MQRWKLTIEYEGSTYYGWQRQDDVPTIQQSIEDAIAKFLPGDRAILHVAGRTDAGVHACGQVAHFDAPIGKRPFTPHDMAKAINAHLRPQPISIIQAEPVSIDFHARFGAINKLYCYRIIARPSFLTFDSGRALHVYRPLDVAAMRMGAAHLIGIHDFTTFRDSECQAKSPVRGLTRLDITETLDARTNAQMLHIETESKSFLHHQVRNMVGTLTLVGKGKWHPDDVKTALEARDRSKGGPTAPSAGLYLMRVDYS